MYVPKRGDFVWLQFNPQSGYEQMGRRPALVLSHGAFNKRMGCVFVCPVSNTQHQNPFYVPVPEEEAVTGVIMADQLRSLDYKARKAEYMGDCPEPVLNDVLRRIKPIIF
ncbi:type II toxin-antitoxin system PemK/MazF family toxin [Lyngbya confervoides]|uniref:Type II toxin-antitoxin system PemK/MazF family toxin n=1 Tax=Lyngbya confervoides BDU141951 TaxID=1574623 RepID=A0ABD4T0W5_9CYAN|nr:type II toxin-antitoxin system PemK/MazF family toxin [Lyngbya confervoides]MCM1982416.1 type II toxin-antitoxin system PemK/MazF family toxin [Lyngbya confervoides BDU141951]